MTFISQYFVAGPNAIYESPEVTPGWECLITPLCKLQQPQEVPTPVPRRRPNIPPVSIPTKSFASEN